MPPSVGLEGTPTTSPASVKEYEFDLRVLRLAGTEEAGPAVPAESPPPILRGCFAAADQEHRRLTTTINPKFYYELAVPAHAEVDEETARGLIASLQLDDSFPGVFGPQQVTFEGRAYKVWIQAFPCG